jgi:hypothetical protein
MDQEPTLPKKPKPSNNYLRYSGLGFQLLGVISFFTWLGFRADSFFQLKFPVFLISLLFLSFFGMLYKLYMDVKS